VNIVECDINNKEECCRVFIGAYDVFAMTYYWDAKTQGEHEQAFNLMEAAKATNVQHFITSGLPHTSLFKKDQLDLPLYPV
jgi:hypothetical protein